MKRFILSIIFIGSILFFPSCIREDLEGCKQYIQFVYDYNMSYTDLFCKEATKMDLYIYDLNGKFVCNIADEKSAYFPYGYKISLPESLPDGKYSLIAWSGLYDDSYNCANPMEGRSILEDHFVTIKNYENCHVGFQMKPLWHGMSEIQLDKGSNKVDTIPLMKNTKQFRIVMQDLTDGQLLDVKDYGFEIKSVNGCYDYCNTVSGDEISYTPYYTYNDTLAGAVAELNTQRLMAGVSNRLCITDKQSNKSIININLDKYLAALRLQQYKDIPYQEYLDRTDEYAIIFFFKGLEPGGDYISFEMQINKWFIREQEEDL